MPAPATAACARGSVCTGKAAFRPQAAYCRALASGAVAASPPARKKDTRHVVLEAADCAAPYQVGDSLGVVARNSPDLVDAIIERLAAARDIAVQSPDGVERPLIEALSDCCEIRSPSDQAIEVLASRAIDREESRVLQAMAEGYPSAPGRTTRICSTCSTIVSVGAPCRLSELDLVARPAAAAALFDRLVAEDDAALGEIHLAVAVGALSDALARALAASPRPSQATA